MATSISWSIFTVSFQMMLSTPPTFKTYIFLELTPNVNNIVVDYYIIYREESTIITFLE